MKKYLTLIVGIAIVLFFVICYFIETRSNNNNDLRKISVADTTLTSRTYMN